MVLGNLFGKKSGAHQWRGVINEYRSWLPVTDQTPIISLCEGGTPLVHAEYFSKLLGNEIWLKVEGVNPTGSFKDRGMTMAISKAAEEGAKAVVCASTGNTSASAAAYATKAGMKPVVLVPQGKIAMGKLAQAVAHVFASHQVSIQTVRQTGAGDKAELIVMTHSSKESALSATVKDLGKLAAVTDVASVLRVEGIN